MMESLPECATVIEDPAVAAAPTAAAAAAAADNNQDRRYRQLSNSRTQRSGSSCANSQGSQVSLRAGRPPLSSAGSIHRNSQNLDLLLERLNSELGSLRLQGFRSLTLTQSNLSLQHQQQQQQQQCPQTVGSSWRASREDADLMEGIAELDTLLELRKSDGAEAVQKRRVTLLVAAPPTAVTHEPDDPPVFSPADVSAEDAGPAAAAAAAASVAVNRGGKFRWSSFARYHRPSLQTRDAQIAAMTAGQMQALRASAFLEVNRIVREFCPPSKSLMSWFLPKMFKRQKSTTMTPSPQPAVGAEGTTKAAAVAAAAATTVFGVPLSTVQIRCGQPLPSGVIHLLRQLRRCGVSAHGIFRRAGGRARVQALRSQLNDDPDKADFAECLPYDLADLVKMYLRELPECLMTQKLSPTLMEIFTHVTEDATRLSAMQSTMLLLPDENREVLQALLYFLDDFADCAETTQMGASNLAVCLAPSLFYFQHEAAAVDILGAGASTSPQAAPAGRRLRRRTTGVPDQRDLADHRAATACLTFMIENCHQLFLAPEAALEVNGEKSDGEESSTWQPPSLDVLAPKDGTGRRRCFTFADNHGQALAKECGSQHHQPHQQQPQQQSYQSGKWRQFSNRSGVQSYYRGLNDGHPLRLWKAVIAIEAEATAVLNRIVGSRPKWDPDVLSSQLVEAIDENSDVVRLSVTSPPAQPGREACLLRAWRSDSSTSHRVHAASVKLPPTHLTLQIHVLTEDWLIEQVTSQAKKARLCRVTLLSRVDLKGHAIDWYNRTWGHTMARQLVHLKKSFLTATS